MAMKFKHKVLYAAVEATEDQGETLTSAHAVQTRNLEVRLYEGSKVSKDVDRLTNGAQEQINVGPHTVMSFDVLAAGSEVAGQAPAWGDLMRMVGFQQVVDATPGSESTTYNLVSSDYESGHLEIRRPIAGQSDQQQYKSTGVRGDWSLELSSGQLPLLKFSNMMGTWYKPANVAALTRDVGDYKDPVPVTADNTPVIQIDGYNCVLSQFTVSRNNEITRRDVPGERRTVISDHAVRGQITVKAPSVADKDFFASLESHNGITKVPVNIQHGTSDGNIIKVSMPTIQLGSISETAVDGELGYQFDYVAIPTDAGDDELQIILPHTVA